MAEFPVLETSRLVLRGLLPEDESAIFTIYSNPEVTRFCDIVTLADRQQAGRLLAFFQSQFEKNTGIRWGITEKGLPGVIGLCGVVWYPHNRSALLSYDLDQNYWSRGIMTEAVDAVIRYVFTTFGINRITATTCVENKRSIRVLQHSGFQEEGILRDWGFWKGRFEDLRCFSRLRRDLRAGLTGREAAHNRPFPEGFAVDHLEACPKPKNSMPQSQ